MNTELESGVRDVFSKILLVDSSELKPDSRRGELEAWDSMAHLDLVAELEARFSIRIEPDDALAIETFADAVRVVHGLVGDG